MKNIVLLLVNFFFFDVPGYIHSLNSPSCDSSTVSQDTLFKKLDHEPDLLTKTPGSRQARFNVLSTNPHIFWASESAGPGEEIAIQGDFSDSAKVCLAMIAGSDYVELAVISHMTGFVKAELPSTVAMDVYRIWINDGAKRSESHFINQARGDCFNSSDVYSNAQVAIKGRNLMLPGKTPTIRFVSVSDGTSLPGTYLLPGSNNFKLNFSAPSRLVAGMPYKVYISNGSSADGTETPVAGELMTIAAAVDTFNLGVAWHARFLGITRNMYNAKRDSRLSLKVTGNGVTNDLPAIQAALNKASADGGGTIYLPAGKYLCMGEGFWGLQLPSNVILKGAGKGLTIIKYGKGSAINKIVGSYYQKNVGICNLSIQCSDANGAFGAGLFSGENIFISHVKWDLKKGDWLEITNSKNVAMIDCDFRQEANDLIHGPTRISNCEFVTLKRNNLVFVTAGISMYNSSKCFIEDNKLIRDASMPILAGSVIHLMVCEFLKDALLANNKLTLVNGPIARRADGSPRMNDGESIISENGGLFAPDVDHGVVSSATSYTLADASKSWSNKFELKPHVAIIHGRGVGQVRRIVSRTTTNLTLDSAWDVLPNNTSEYSIFNYGLERVAIINNELRDQQRGITLYHNPMQRVDIVNNVLTNSGSIDITPIEVADGKNKFTPIYNIEVEGNYVDGSTDPYNGVSIGVQAIQHMNTRSWGTICTNLRMVRNTIIGSIPNKDVIQDELFPSGYHNYLVFHSGGVNYKDENIPVILGTIMAGNTAVNLGEAVHLNTGSYLTSVSKTVLKNSPILVKDPKIPGTIHASVGTVIR